PAIAVVMMHIIFESRRRFIIVFIKNVGSPARHARGRDQLKLGIISFDRVIKLSEPPVITSGLIEEIFIANLDIVNREWLRMAVGDALRSPIGVGSTR